MNKIVKKISSQFFIISFLAVVTTLLLYVFLIVPKIKMERKERADFLVTHASEIEAKRKMLQGATVGDFLVLTENDTVCYITHVFGRHFREYDTRDKNGWRENNSFSCQRYSASTEREAYLGFDRFRIPAIRDIVRDGDPRHPICAEKFLKQKRPKK